MTPEQGTVAARIPLVEVLQAVALEVGRLTAAARRIEDEVGNAIAGEGSGATLSRSLQGLDHVVQSMEGIGRFIDRLRDEVDSGIDVSPTAAAREIGLRRLAIALSCSAQDGDDCEMVASDVQDGGRVQLF